MMPRPLVIGTRSSAPLADELGADLVELPPIELDGDWTTGSELYAWRTASLRRDPSDGIVVAVWPESAPSSPIVDTEPDAWSVGLEQPFALWFTALAVAADRCADGGQLVAVADRPQPKACAGRSLSAALADMVEVTAHSLVELHGSRGVGFTLVTDSERFEDPGGIASGGTRAQLLVAVESALASISRPGTLTVVHVTGGTGA